MPPRPEACAYKTVKPSADKTVNPCAYKTVKPSAYKTVKARYNSYTTVKARKPAVPSARHRPIRSPLPSEHGTYRTVTARLWPWLSGENPQNLLSCPLFARQRHANRTRSAHVGLPFGTWKQPPRYLAQVAGLVFKAHILVYHSTLCLRVIKKREEGLRG